MNRSLTVASLTVASLTVAAAGQPFTPTGIGNLAGGPSVAWGITSWAGPNFAVVGETDTNNSLTYRGCTFTTGMLAINTGSGPGGFFTPKVCYRINSAPSILIHVGAGQSASLNTRAFRTNGGLTFELGTLNPGLPNSEARGVNIHGLIVGHCWAANSYPGAIGNQSFAFQWVPSGGPSSNTGAMSMIPLHAAYDVNDSGIAVGQLNGLPYRLNISTNGLTNLGTLGGLFGSGVALSINNAGVIVGNSPAATTNLQHAFRWNGSGLQDIHPVPLIGSGSGASYAYDVQDVNGANGMVVGRYIGPNTGSGGHAFVYNPANGFFRDLNTWLPSGSGWVLEAAHGINDAHCVVGRGRRNGQIEGFRMCITPPLTPQPPCGGGNPLIPTGVVVTCPGGGGGTTHGLLPLDPTSVGVSPGMPAQVEWAWLPRDAGEGLPNMLPLVDGLNADPLSGTLAFNAAFNSDGSVVISPPGGTPEVPAAVSAGWVVRALVRGPCDTRFSHGVQVLPSPADVGTQGGQSGKDGRYDNNDFIAYIDGFFMAAPWADIGAQGGVLGGDERHDNNDFVVFIDQFFGACG